MIGTHKHHIVPRHAGGIDDPSNLIELTVIDHAIAHKVLYGLWKRDQDRIAWQMLSGRITSEEARKQSASLGQKNRDNSSFKTEEYRNNQRLKSIARNARPPTHFGKNHPLKNPIHKVAHLESLQTIDYKQKQSKNAKRNWQNPKYRELMIKRLKGRELPLLVCPNCGVSGKGSSMYRWHFENCKKK